MELNGKGLFYLTQGLANFGEESIFFKEQNRESKTGTSTQADHTASKENLLDERPELNNQGDSPTRRCLGMAYRRVLWSEQNTKSL